ncbi:MAG: DUF4424 domain-containing protein, partial [Proteobacteria bacterium]
MRNLSWIMPLRSQTPGKKSVSSVHLKLLRLLPNRNWADRDSSPKARLDEKPCVCRGARQLPAMNRIRPVTALLAALIAVASPALANDSEAEWAVGGLALKQNNAISMDREDLYISASEVRVDYTYTNHADTAQTVLISFPIPPLPGTEAGWMEYGAYPDWSELGFSTTVDGKPVQWQVAERAMIGTRDVTDAVAAAGYPLRWYQDYEWVEATSRVSPVEAQPMIDSGLFLPATEDWSGSVMPAWQVQYHVTREQTFPAHASVKVAHRYQPIIGGSVGGLLDVIDSGEYEEQKAYYEARFCIDPSFING